MTTQKVVAIFGSSRTEPGSLEWDDAERAGTRIAGAGLAVVTGGYGGTMEAASRGAALAGGRVIGVTAPVLFQDRFGANSHVAEEIATSTLAERIGALTDLADAILVLPGSIGTAAELAVAWNMNHLARYSGWPRTPTVAVGEQWRQVWSIFTNGIGATGDDVHVSDTADDAIEWLLGQPEISLI